jgi:ubiquinone/menaquinone biosynthesis C-methylase UbiE
MSEDLIYKTTEITSHDDSSDNVIHRRQLYAYEKAVEYIEGKVLELGCGTGRGLELFAHKCEDYTGIDKEGGLLAVHRKNYPNFTFLDQNMPPFANVADNSIDWLVTFQVIEHIEDDNQFVKEIHRVLKPGGKAIVTTPNIKQTLSRNPWHIREYTGKELETLFAKHFKNPQIMGIHGSETVMNYHRKNAESVNKIMRFDIFNLQYRLPRQVLQVPYEILNRMNRKKLEKGNDSLVAGVTTADFHLSDKVEGSLDLWALVVK